MQYRKFGKSGLNVSAMGLGTKKLPHMIGDDGRIDVDKEKTKELIRKAIDNGVNYIDSAYNYYDGRAEMAVGEALLDGYREKTYIATKCPLWLIHSEEDFDRILDEQLERLKTDHIDFYMFHSLNSINWNDVVLTNRLLFKMEEAKKNGKIKYIGFTFHDNYDMFETVLRVYNWDFCQINLNYIEYDKEATLEGVKLAARKGIAVVAMGVLAGGKLADPPVNVANVLWDLRTPVEWAYDYVWDMPEVSIVLMGAEEDEHLEQNIKYADVSAPGMLLVTEKPMYERAKVIYDTVPLVNCNKCSYCMPCPMGINIPKVLDAYNRIAIDGIDQALKLYSSNYVKADQCKNCKACESVCPNMVKVSEIMAKVHNTFTGVN